MFLLEKVLSLLARLVQTVKFHSRSTFQTYRRTTSQVVQRDILDCHALLHQKIDAKQLNPGILAGKYIPNLIAKPFEVSREYTQLFFTTNGDNTTRLALPITKNLYHSRRVARLPVRVFFEVGFCTHCIYMSTTGLLQTSHFRICMILVFCI